MYVIYVAVLSWLVAACAVAQTKGFTKRIITFKALDKCPDQGLGTWTYASTLVKSGGAYLLNSNCTWPIDINENMKFRVTSALFKDGQYNEGYLDVLMNGCNQFEQLSNGFLKDLFASSDIENNQCPYPKGTYIYKNFKMESRPILPVSTPNGLYKLSAYIMDSKDNVLGCGRAFVEIKSSKRKGNQ